MREKYFQMESASEMLAQSQTCSADSKLRDDCKLDALGQRFFINENSL